MSRNVSIVIPTWNHLEDLLIPCVNSIEKYTSGKYDLEFIFVANGCTDGTLDWLRMMSEKNPVRYRFHFTTEQIGFTKAANIGFKMATADHTIILNNDTEILDFGGMDTWLDKMFAPFDADAKVAATGPLKIFDFYSNREFLVGFCVMYRTDLLKAFGYFDEAFAPAGGEDVDLAIRLQDGGWKIASVQETTFNGWTNTGDFPMWHKDNRSYKDLPEYTQTIVKRNGHLNCKRHNKNIRLNLGGGGISYKGYLNVDLYDKRADILMDITKNMDFASDSVNDILASHLFEHLNPYHAFDILKEWLRILKPGGRLVMEMPNIEELCKRFVTANKGERYGILNAVYGSVNTTGVGGPDNITAPHLFGWWPEALYDHLAGAGFTNIQFMSEQIPHPESNLRVEALKPGTPLVQIPLEPLGTVENARHNTKVEETPPPPKEEPKVPEKSSNYVSDTNTTPEQYAHEEIFNMNVYGVEPNEIKGKTVIDIGAYTGEFVEYSKKLGAEMVLAYELNPSNYQKLFARTKDMTGVATFNLAVYSPDKTTVHFADTEGLCKVVEESDSPSVETTTLSKILRVIPNDNNLVLKIDCEGSEFPILMSATPDELRRFSIIYAELHDVRISGKPVTEMVKYLSDVGFNAIDLQMAVVYTEKDALGDVMKQELLAKTYKFVRSESGPVEYVENPGNPYGVTAYISTKDRYFTTLPLAIMGIANQTFKVDELILFDDGEQKDLRQESLYANLFRYLEMKGISWRVVFGERKGQVANHQKALELAKTEYIWRVDDDNYPESEVLARLMLWCTCPVEKWEQPFGAVGSLVRVPYQEIFPLDKCSGDIMKSPDTPNLQWSAFGGVLHTDHLHNTFLYRKSAARHGYPKNLSPVGHREETLFTHGIKQNGYRMLVCGDVITWHFRESKGGIRSYDDAKLWEHDEQIFREEMKKRGVLFDNKRYVVLDNGIGDHYAFKHVLPEMIAKYGKDNIVLATCFPEVFEEMGVRQISIAEAHTLFGDLTKFNIYHWMWKWDWKKSLVDAFHTMYALA
jgi:FkbM family methyltransferase